MEEFSIGGCMDVVQKFMDWLGYDRVNQRDMDDGPVKVIYVKRGVNQISDEARQNSSVREDAAAAARSHVGLTLVEQAILWIFESIRSLWSKPAESMTENSIINTNLPSATEIETEAEKEAKNQANKIAAAKEDFKKTKNFIGSFLRNNDWPNANNVFSDEVLDIAKIHWNNYENFPYKSITTEDDRLDYAAAAFVLGKNRPSFEPARKTLEFPSPLVTDNPVIEEEHISFEDIVPKISKGEELFLQFFKLYEDRDFVGLESLGSPFFQPESLEFARKIIDEDNRIKKTFSPPPLALEVAAAKYLRSRKISLEGSAEEASRRQAERAEAEQITKVKEQLQPGEWEFKEFVNKFVERRDNDQRFILQEDGKYLTNVELLEFAAMVKINDSTTLDQKQAAEYLSKWSLNRDAAAEAAGKEDGFSWPPEPAAPPPRRTAAVPKVEPPPISPDRQAVESLLGADAGQQRQLLGLMVGLDAGVFYSGLEVFATIWPGQPSSISGKSLSGRPSSSLDGSYLAHTDLEKADNAIKVMNAIANLKTGHDINLSRTVEMMKNHRDLVGERLVQYRRQIIDKRQIFPVENMTADQIDRGQKIFEEFRRSFEAALNREEPDKLIMRDTYFLDECVSYAEYLQGIYSTALPLTDADQKSQVAIAYLMSKYNRFKSTVPT
jgi:hypothetical protein